MRRKNVTVPFVVCSANSKAYQLTRLVVEGSSKLPNALYIWGAEGVGKTHLLRTLQCRMTAKDVFFCSIGDDLLAYSWLSLAFSRNCQHLQYRRMCSARLLILDDCTALVGRRMAEHVVRRICAQRWGQGKVTVIASNDPCRKAIQTLPSLAYHLESAVSVKMGMPRYEDRKEILAQHLISHSLEQYLMAKDVSRLASYRFANIRRMVSAAIRMAFLNELQKG